jgi:hypothetical protein
MLKVPKRLHLLVVVAMTLTAAAFAGSVVAGSALADGGHQWESPETPPTLSGDWAGLNRCPVDNPTMLAADGLTNIAFCLTVASPNGSLTIGGLTLPTKASDLQAGVVLNETDGSATLVSPADGAAENESIEVPNGLQALICPSHGRLSWRVCRPPRHDGRDYEHSSQLTNLTVSMVPAGEPSNFSLFAGLSLNQPLLSLPVKLHLQNRLLGNRCYIGSDAEPIVIQPENITEPAVHFEAFDGNGTPDPNGLMTLIQLVDTQGSSSFAVPAATGCGFMGIFDEAIDNHMGLPSAAGKNSLVFNEAKTVLVAISTPEGVAPNDGQELSKAWHSAVQPEEENEGRHHRHGH